MPNASINGQMSPFCREAMRIQSTLAVMTSENLSGDVFRQLEKDLERLSDILAQTYLG